MSTMDHETPVKSTGEGEGGHCHDSGVSDSSSRRRMGCRRHRLSCILCLHCCCGPETVLSDALVPTTVSTRSTGVTGSGNGVPPGGRCSCAHLPQGSPQSGPLWPGGVIQGK